MFMVNAALGITVISLGLTVKVNAGLIGTLATPRRAVGYGHEAAR